MNEPDTFAELAERIAVVTSPRTHWKKYRKKAIELGATANELPAKTNSPFYDLSQLGKFCSARASEEKEYERETKKIRFSFAPPNIKEKPLGDTAKKHENPKQHAPEGEWSKPMSKSLMRSTLGIENEHKFNAYAKSVGIKPAGNRQTWQLRLDTLSPKDRSKMENVEV